MKIIEIAFRVEKIEDKIIVKKFKSKETEVYKIKPDENLIYSKDFIGTEYNCHLSSINLITIYGQKFSDISYYCGYMYFIQSGKIDYKKLIKKIKRYILRKGD